MSPLERKVCKQLQASFTQAEQIAVQCEGNHCLVSLRCNSFADQKPLQRHQRVNACLKDLIASGEVHALRIDAQPAQ